MIIPYNNILFGPSVKAATPVMKKAFDSADL